MEFRGNTMHEQIASRRIWTEWLQTLPADSGKRVFAERFVALVEARITPPAGPRNQYLGTAASEAMRRAERGRPLQASELREVLLKLVECWRYSVSLRNWAIAKSYLEPTD